MAAPEGVEQMHGKTVYIAASCPDVSFDVFVEQVRLVVAWRAPAAFPERFSAAGFGVVVDTLPDINDVEEGMVKAFLAGVVDDGDLRQSCDYSFIVDREVAPISTIQPSSGADASPGDGSTAVAGGEGVRCSSIKTSIGADAIDDGGSIDGGGFDFDALVLELKQEKKGEKSEA